MEDDREERFNRINKIKKKDIEKMLKEKICLRKVIFTSGEPTTNNKLLQYIRMAKNIGYPTIALVTNGRMLSYAKYCDSLISSGVNEIIISLHSSNKNTHEALTRTPRSFEQTLRGLQNMANLKKQHNFRLYVSMVLNKINFGNLEEDMNFFSKLNIDGLILNTLQPLGRGKNLKLLIRYTDIVKEMRKLQGRGLLKPNVCVVDIPFCVAKPIGEVSKSLEISHIKQKTGYLYPTLDHRIKIKGCKICKNNNACQGIWENYVKIFGSEEFRPIRSNFLGNEGYAVLYGLKKVQRGNVRERDYEELKKEYNDLGIYVTASNFKVEFKQGLQKFTDKGELLFYASKSKDMAEKLKFLEEMQVKNHKIDYKKITTNLGLILGYPKCCIDFFIRYTHLLTPNIYFNVLKNTKGKAKAELNIFEGINTISHIPCSFDCEKSIKYARKLIEKTKIDINILKGNYLYFSNGCFIKLELSGENKRKNYKILKVSNGDFGGSFNDFEPAKEILNYLKKGEELEINESIVIYKKEKEIFTNSRKFKDWVFIEFS